ncbi:MAG: succinylglutamate desuccinylase/aspartoacylase family protein [Hydrococcus sp. C42_A2020_068]|uniref:M14 family zinc carboxypeptidase n=1 Tax=Pleurocapsa sp. PCC 7327 TaxID=118163 RepID=UPI00029FC72E|nr:succinylglutamate desuccinylase/aspartoacylase family protein [Pleurocapsa sp. PCC 7327]AFY77176.1 putative deacylase [Pleurocapsa sp. PCC 7327]MBF2019328.1 succinylglutamate desuccinylase/aspartoacylase family protein [Hydrococcus sp. C42_A2020_068]
MIPITSQIDLLQLASGDNLSIQVYKFIGKQPGKKVYIQSNLHGSEIVGNAVIHQLIEFLTELDEDRITGEIWLVPVCNPLGTNQRSHFFSAGRFNSYDGRDWNRIFWDYEKECEDLATFVKTQKNLDIKEVRKNFLEKQKAAFAKQLERIQKPSSVPYRDRYRYQLQSLCLDADFVIDIHSSSNQGIDYLYCFQGREESAKYFFLEYGILMTEYDGNAFDEAFMKPWLALEKQLTKLGKAIKFDLEAWTLELGSGMQMNPESVEVGVKGIKNYLAYKGILTLAGHSVNYPASTEIQLVRRHQIKNYYAIAGGMIQKRVPLKTSVKAGDRLYQLLSFNKSGDLPTAIDICAETDGLVFDISTNQSVNQGEYVLGILNFEL